jgi:hypothetical protein
MPSSRCFARAIEITGATRTLAKKADNTRGRRLRGWLELDRALQAPTSLGEIVQLDVKVAELRPSPAVLRMSLDSALREFHTLLAAPSMIVVGRFPVPHARNSATLRLRTCSIAQTRG